MKRLLLLISLISLFIEQPVSQDGDVFLLPHKEEVSSGSSGNFPFAGIVQPSVSLLSEPSLPQSDTAQVGLAISPQAVSEFSVSLDPGLHLLPDFAPMPSVEEHVLPQPTTNTLTGALARRPPRVRFISQPDEVIPGEHFTLVVDIHNSNQVALACSASVLLPPGWMVVLHTETFTLQPETSQKLYLTLKPSGEIAGGVNTLSIVIHSIDTETVEKKIFVKVREHHKIEVEVEYAPEYVQAGTTFESIFVVRNLGNVPEKLRLSSVLGKINGSVRIDLGPFVSQQVRVRYSTRADLATVERYRAELSAQIDSLPQPVIGQTLIRVYPTRTPKSDPYFRFPVKVSANYLNRYLYGQGYSAFQGEILGMGYLDVKSRHYLDFILRGPNQLNQPQFGSFDQYSFNYQSPTISVQVVDYSLRVSNLIESSRFGRGLQISKPLGKWSLTAFYMKPRFFRDIREEFGTYITYQPTSTLQIQFNLMQKQLAGFVNPFRANLASISANFHKNEISVEAESGLSMARGKLTLGGSYRLNAVFKATLLSSNLIYANKDFYGYYTNTSHITNSVYQGIGKKIRIGIGQNYSMINKSMDIYEHAILPKYINYFGEILYTINTKNNLRVGYQYREKADRTSSRSFDYNENLIRYAYMRHGKFFGVWLSGELGETQNFLVSERPEARTFFQDRVQLTGTFSQFLSAGANLEYLWTSRFSDQNLPQQFMYYGGNVHLRLKKNWDLSLFYRNNYPLDELSEKKNFMDGQLNVTVKDNHTFSLRGSYAIFPGQNGLVKNMFISAKYTLSLHPALKKVKNLGHISGKLVGLSDEKVQGVLIQAGDITAITDKNGTFAFNDLLPGTHYISVQRTSLQMDDIVGIEMPLAVEVVAGKPSDVQIPIIKGAILKGRVEFGKASQTTAESAAPQGKPLIIRLSGMGKVFLTETDPKGEFAFTELKAGIWQVQLLPSPLWQETYSLESEIQEITLEAGKVASAEFRLVPKERRMHMSNQKPVLIKSKQ